MGANFRFESAFLRKGRSSSARIGNSMKRTLVFLLLLSPAAFAQPQYDAELTGYAYPFPVQRYRLTTQRESLSMAYMDVQPPSANGETVLLLHGKNFSGAYWDKTIRHLIQRGYRVVVPDQIGFGKSSKPERFQFTFQELANDTAGLLKFLGINGKIHLVGHSMGGMLATRFALMFPDRIASLSLIDPIGLEDWKRLVAYHSVDQNFQSEMAATPETIRNYEQQNYFAGQWDPAWDYLVDIPDGWNRGPDRAKVAWDAALTSDMIFTQPVLYEFGDLKVPTMLMIGQQDRTALGKAWARPEIKARMGNYPELGRLTQKAIPNCELVEVPGAGHLPQVQQFDLYIQNLDNFLLRHKQI
jgi:pimeloyl-ACP methyl ester carboxylesterase